MGLIMAWVEKGVMRLFGCIHLLQWYERGVLRRFGWLPLRQLPRSVHGRGGCDGRISGDLMVVNGPLSLSLEDGLSELVALRARETVGGGVSLVIRGNGSIPVICEAFMLGVVN